MMSHSLVKKSLRLFEEGTIGTEKGLHSTLKKDSKKKRQILSRHKNQGNLKEKNIQKNFETLKLLSRYTVSAEISKKIINHTVKGGIPLELVAKKEEKTVFTEEDFEAFEREYTGDN